MSTIIDIARLAGVSKSTVSRVLTGSGYVGEETRARIEKIMEEQGFQPSQSARTLSTKKTNTIGIIIPEISNPFYTEVMEGIAPVVDEEDLSIIYCNTDNDPVKEEKAIRMLTGQGVQGIIFAPAIDYVQAKGVKQILSRLSKVSAPVVLLDRNLENSGLDSVLYDNYGAAYAAASELIRAGNKTIGMITGNMKLKISRDRYNGYMSALFDHEYKVDSRFVFYGDDTIATSYELSCEMLKGEELPDAIVTTNNLTTLGFLRALQEHSMRVGRDIALMAIDHIRELDYIAYPYSCVTRDMQSMGRDAMRLLMERIANPEKEKCSIIIPYEVKLGGSEKKSRRKKDQT